MGRVLRIGADLMHKVTLFATTVVFGAVVATLPAKSQSADCQRQYTLQMPDPNYVRQLQEWYSANCGPGAQPQPQYQPDDGAAPPADNIYNNQLTRAWNEMGQ